jgi:hypothetical protein
MYGARTMSKGAIATIDVIFAIAVASIIMLSLSAAPQGKYQNLALERTANDILAVLDKQDTLETVDQSAINSSLQQLLPTNVDAQLTIRCYRYCSDIGKNCTTKFYLNNTFTVSSFSNANNGDSITTRRFFMTNSTIPLYCISELGAQIK